MQNVIKELQYTFFVLTTLFSIFNDTTISKKEYLETRTTLHNITFFNYGKRVAMILSNVPILITWKQKKS